MRERGRGGGEGVRTRDHLANVRTTLAWVRVGIVLIGIGYALDKLAAIGELMAPGRGLAFGRPLGVVVVACGVVVAAASLARFLGARARIESSRFEPWPAIDLALAGVVGTCALVILLGLAVAR